MSNHHQVLIVGGGTAGITLAARLLNRPDAPRVTVIEPSDKHFYQPLWTLVGAGVFPKEASMRDEADFMPQGAAWLRERVSTFEPENSAVILESGQRLTYDILVVAAGIQLDWHLVKGAKEAMGKDGVCSNYQYDMVDYTWKFLQGLKSGTAIFTMPPVPIKCAGAPQKIMWLAEHYLQKQGIRSKVNVAFATAGAGIFGVPKYAASLNKLVKERSIQTYFQHNLIEVRGPSKEAVFRKVGSSEEVVVKYDLLHITPPQGSPEFIRSSPLADAGGWVEVHKHTTQHLRFPNIFSLGDCSSLPNSKTGAAVRKQAPVTEENLMALLQGKPLTAQYDGYASCPLVTGYGRAILAEFGYDGKIMETFPFDQSQERFSMYMLKAYGLPDMYWHGMLRGRM